jgi:catechol 2,3-dioxygenase-like lactoylglutathione lyase family enzyme
MSYIISGIQQVGIGNPDVHAAFAWYRRNFGVDIPILDENSEANQMLPYTGGKPHQRHAILAINLKGGGGFEIWQYVSRKPEPCPFAIELGDLGFTIAKMKTDDVRASYEMLRNKNVKLLTEIVKDPLGNEHFYLEDLYGNLFEVVKGSDWFSQGAMNMGGPNGMVIGVSDVERSKKFYADILGYDKVLFDEEKAFDDLKGLRGSEKSIRRVLLTHSKPRQGSFSKLLGNSFIELIKVNGRAPRKIFENRFWGDMGFIHLCFDIKNMQSLKKHCAEKGYPFTVESNPDFDMGDAAGQFAYIEDPDGALIEFVETHKIPVVKKINWYLNLDKMNPAKPLPSWMLKALRFNRVKD